MIGPVLRLSRKIEPQRTCRPLAVIRNAMVSARTVRDYNAFPQGIGHTVDFNRQFSIQDEPILVSCRALSPVAQQFHVRGVKIAIHPQAYVAIDARRPAHLVARVTRTEGTVS